MLSIPKYGYVGIGLVVAGIALALYTAFTSELIEYNNITLPANEMLPYFIGGISMLIAGIVLTTLAFIKRKVEIKQ
ncbi:MAG: hypothetical protein KatS3mg003_1723 [Candidatus Nitrosocaldaceae archaeon]|nr:MAG: hypothetical protein KatS3mg003_1723 [Candidatus Nitrosocaldaceae archaeon]